MSPDLNSIGTSEEKMSGTTPNEVSSTSLPPPTSTANPKRKQLSNSMQHLQGFVTVSPSDSPTPTSPTPAQDQDQDNPAYGVPASIQPLRAPRSHGPENALKRSDPFQFGSRLLEEGDDIFAYNAWDHVSVDAEYAQFAEECFARQRAQPVGEFDKKRFLAHPEKMWNAFYANNRDGFFKDRRWLRQEFPVLESVMAEGAGEKVLLEVGAGAGNTAFPILKGNRNEGLRIYACDFSRTAVQVMRGSEEYVREGNVGSIEASVWDVASTMEDGECSLPENIQPGTVDVLMLVFIFSALSPEQWAQALRNVWHALRPGGVVLFRDYGRGDLAQVRFKKGRWMGENFYVRGDGTRVYFFEEEELRGMWSGAGFEIESFGVDRRMLVNRQRKLKMYRVWMQAVFKKPMEEDTGARKDGDDGVATLESAAEKMKVEDTVT